MARCGDPSPHHFHMKKKPKFCQSERWADFKSKLNNVSPDEARKVLENEQLVIIDVRTPEEFTGKTIEGAIHMDYLDDGFIDKLMALDKEQAYLVYCRTGRRSLRVCTWMNNSGFRNIYHLDGGFDSWEGKV